MLLNHFATFQVNFGKIGGGYTCECPEGWKWDATQRTCLDVDECAGKLNIAAVLLYGIIESDQIQVAAFSLEYFSYLTGFTLGQ